MELVRNRAALTAFVKRMCTPAAVRTAALGGALLVAATAAVADDWPTFRGENRTAVAPDQDLLEEWPADGPALLWKAEGTGRGYSSLAIAGDRLYTLGDGLQDAGDDDEYLMCLDRQTGKRIWLAKTGPAWNEGNESWQSSRSTPTVDGNRVYAITAAGELICCDATSGDEVWRKHLVDDFGGKKADGWGYSESVLVDGDQVICTPGGEKATMVGLNKKTGELIWQCSREGDRGAGHASIVISHVGDEKIYVQTTGSGALGVRARDGQLQWSYPIDRTTAVIPTPIVRDDLVFFTAGYRRGGALLRQVAKGDGAVVVEEVYGLNPKLANKHGGLVLVGDYLYGDSDDAGIPFCAEFATGEVLWQKRGSGNGSIAVAAADGHLYLHYANGTVVLAKADSDDYTEAGSFEAPGSGERPSWTHPVICDGRLYLREQGVILCYDVRAPQ